MRPLLLCCLVAALALSATASPVHAQNAPAPAAARLWLELIPLQNDTLIVPEADPTAFGVRVEVRCVDRSAPAGPVRIAHTLQVDQPWAEVRLDQDEHDLDLGPDHCVQGATASYEVTGTIRLTVEAPAFRLAMVQLVATPQDGYQDAYASSFGFRAAFHGGIVVEAPESSLDVVGGGSEQIPVRVQNLANGRVHLTIRLMEGGDHGQVLLPAPHYVGSLVAGSSRDTLVLPVEYLGTRDGTDRLVFRITGTSEHDTRVTVGAHDVEVRVHVDGDAPETVAGELPGIAPLVWIGVVGLGLLRRRA